MPHRVLSSLPRGEGARSARGILSEVVQAETDPSKSAAAAAYESRLARTAGAREALLFHPFYLTSAEVSRVAAGRRGLPQEPVALDPNPSLTLGMGTGLVLCRAILDSTTDGSKLRLMHKNQNTSEKKNLMYSFIATHLKKMNDD